MISVNKLPVGKNPPDDINVVIEIPKGGNIKYEIDAESGAIFVDRKLSTTMFYPGNYGFIPQTQEEDGDPTDVLVLGDDPLLPMSIIRTHPIGVLLTEDEKGQDSKIIAVPIAKIDQNFATFIDVENIPEHMRNQIKYFFEHYKELEQGKYVKVVGMENNEVAKKKISEAIERYKEYTWYPKESLIKFIANSIKLIIPKKNYQNLIEVLANNAIYATASNPTLLLPQSSSTFPNLFDQSDAYRIKEPEIYDNYNGDVAESYTNSLRRLMGH